MPTSLLRKRTSLLRKRISISGVSLLYVETLITYSRPWARGVHHAPPRQSIENYVFGNLQSVHNKKKDVNSINIWNHYRFTALFSRNHKTWIPNYRAAKTVCILFTFLIDTCLMIHRWAFIWYQHCVAGVVIRVKIYSGSLASTRARTRTGNVAEMNYAISAHNPRQTRENCSIHRLPGQYYDCLRIFCGQSWECPRIQSGMVRNATEWADRSQTVRTHLGSHQESSDHGLGQSGCLLDNHLAMQTAWGNYDGL